MPLQRFYEDRFFSGLYKKIFPGWESPPRTSAIFIEPCNIVHTMKRLVVFFITGLLLIAVIGITGCTSNPKTPTAPVSTLTTPVSTPAPIAGEKPDKITLGENNAARKALDYLRVMPFSRDGLIKQLEYEGFTHQQAVYGVDQSGADWNKQAALKAKDYLRLMAFSRDGLIKQLEYEGFTHQQAVYGAQAVGY